MGVNQKRIVQRIRCGLQLCVACLRIASKLASVHDSPAPQNRAVSKSCGPDKQPSPELIVFENQRRGFPGATRWLRPAVERLWNAGPLGLVARAADFLRLHAEQNEQLLAQSEARSADRLQAARQLEKLSPLLDAPAPIEAHADPGG